MVIVLEDGSNLKTAKAFSYNLTEKIKLHAQPDRTNIRQRHNSVSFVRPENESDVRAFKEFLEECSLYLNKNTKLFSVAYNLEGTSFRSFTELKRWFASV